jgi:hypothetical protein
LVGTKIALNFYGGFPLESVEETHWLSFLGSLADDFGIAITITVTDIPQVTAMDNVV